MTHFPRRLALVITELDPGGAERMLVELATRLDRSRYQPQVYSLAPPPHPDRQILTRRLADAQIPTTFLGLRRASEFFSAISTLTSHLRNRPADLVQSFLFHANVVAARAALSAGTPRLVTGIRVADPRWWRIALERMATTRADRFVCVSQSVAEYVRRRGFSSEKLTVIPNGVDLTRWQNAVPADLSPLGVAPGRQAILYVGRLDKQKGLDRFFSDLPDVLEQLPDHDLLLVGDGPLLRRLQKQAARFRFDERVHFLGWRDDVPSLMQASTLLVLPSRWEGMPNVVLEAMAAGKPVVATQSEGTVELLGLGALQQTVPVGDWAGLARRIVEVALDLKLAAQLGRQNQERAEQFSLDRVAERYQRLYDSLCD
jgi:glycosyltransferase involved in cell wall biosynthesis